jgi:hypothetical protein
MVQVRYPKAERDRILQGKEEREEHGRIDPARDSHQHRVVGIDQALPCDYLGNALNQHMMPVLPVMLTTVSGDGDLPNVCRCRAGVTSRKNNWKKNSRSSRNRMTTRP